MWDLHSRIGNPTSKPGKQASAMSITCRKDEDFESLYNNNSKEAVAWTCRDNDSLVLWWDGMDLIQVSSCMAQHHNRCLHMISDHLLRDAHGGHWDANVVRAMEDARLLTRKRDEAKHLVVLSSSRRRAHCFRTRATCDLHCILMRADRIRELGREKKEMAIKKKLAIYSVWISGCPSCWGGFEADPSSETNFWDLWSDLEIRDFFFLLCCFGIERNKLPGWEGEAWMKVWEAMMNMSDCCHLEIHHEGKSRFLWACRGDAFWMDGWIDGCCGGFWRRLLGY